MSQTIYAIIPARQGSKGVVNKNIKNLAGHPLLAYSIAVAKLIQKIDRIIVSTDSQEYAGIAIKYGAEVPFLRPKEISGDKSTDLEFFKHCLNWFQQNEAKTPDFMLHLRPTTPLREASVVDAAIKELMNRDDAACLRSAHICPETPFKWFKKNQQGYFTSIFDDQDLESLNKPRQEFPKVFVPDGYIDILKSKFILSQNQLHGNKVLAFESPHCIEIDSNEEFDFLEYEIKNKGSNLKNYLDKLIQ